MLLSKSCEYGLRAALFLASVDEEGYISIREISDKLDISFHFLTKILQQLKAEELVASFKGPNGGVQLAKPGQSIKLLDIIEAIDGDDLFNECVLGLPGCGDRKPCAMHNKWTDHRKGIKEMLEITTLKELAEESKSENFRINVSQSFNDL
ncbi:MAG TPA: Rrf2 family transcriptional regulator [Balneolaceae bacterium]|nr:Rrf2 family transcriptional regulator [Balneolaceae bacterium]